jgi:hypothetical protein
VQHFGDVATFHEDGDSEVFVLDPLGQAPAVTVG